MLCMSINIPEINYYQINNNTKIIFLHGGKNIFRIEVINRIGSADENKDEYGLAHFYEHMIFKGTYKGKRIIDIIEFYGCSFNANTTRNETKYWITGSSEHNVFMVDIILQMIFEPQFPECDIEKEKQVVLEELYMSKNSAGNIISSNINNILFKDVDESLCRPIIGYEENILKFNRNKLLDFYKNKFTKKEKIIILMGNFDKEYIKKHISNILAPLKPWTPTFMSMERELIIKHHNQMPQGIIHIDIPQDYCAVNIMFRSINNMSCWILTGIFISSILAGGSSSRLFKVLREENGLTYYQNTNNYRYDEHGIFNVSFGVRAEGFKQTLDLIMEQTLSFTDVNDYELQVIKNKFETELLFDSESPLSIGSTAIDYIVSKKDPETYKNFRNRIHKIKPKHVNNFAKKIFTRENMTVFVACNKEIYNSLNLNM